MSSGTGGEPALIGPLRKNGHAGSVPIRRVHDRVASSVTPGSGALWDEESRDPDSRILAAKRRICYGTSVQAGGLRSASIRSRRNAPTFRRFRFCGVIGSSLFGPLYLRRFSRRQCPVLTSNRCKVEVFLFIVRSLRKNCWRGSAYPSSAPRELADRNLLCRIDAAPVLLRIAKNVDRRSAISGSFSHTCRADPAARSEQLTVIATSRA